MIHYKAIKLKNGELIACSTPKDFTMKDVKKCSTFEVDNPVVFQSFKFVDNDGELIETISMMPMMPIVDVATVEITTDHIFSVADMRPQAAEKYVVFVEHLQKQLIPSMDEQAQAEYDEYNEDEYEADNIDYNPRILH